ncbi:MAG: thioredoxin family protein [Immundisolibacterales bacterium]|nr:thioredoxin family protein [Immundisolibacterales bacterium]
MNENPAYQAVTVMKVDWDAHSGSDAAKDHGVRRRATLVMLSGGEEVGRVNGSTRRDDIEALFKAAI